MKRSQIKCPSISTTRSKSIFLGKEQTDACYLLLGISLTLIQHDITPPRPHQVVTVTGNPVNQHKLKEFWTCMEKQLLPWGIQYHPSFVPNLVALHVNHLKPAVAFRAVQVLSGLWRRSKPTHRISQHMMFLIEFNVRSATSSTWNAMIFTRKVYSQASQEAFPGTHLYTPWSQRNSFWRRLNEKRKSLETRKTSKGTQASSQIQNPFAILIAKGTLCSYSCCPSYCCCCGGDGGNWCGNMVMVLCH